MAGYNTSGLATVVCQSVSTQESGISEAFVTRLCLSIYQFNSVYLSIYPSLSVCIYIYIRKNVYILSEVIINFVFFSSCLFLLGVDMTQIVLKLKTSFFLLPLVSCVILDWQLNLSGIRHAYLSKGVTTTCPDSF